MSITRADVELELVSRVGGWLTNAGLDGTTADGTNASLNSPIRYGIQGSGGSVVNASLVTDADVQTVPSAGLDRLYDLAEYRTLENTLSYFNGVDKKAGPVEIKSSQFADRLERRLAALRSWLSLTYGIGGSTDVAVSASVSHVVSW